VQAITDRKTVQLTNLPLRTTRAEVVAFVKDRLNGPDFNLYWGVTNNAEHEGWCVVQLDEPADSVLGSLNRSSFGGQQIRASCYASNPIVLRTY
jgi:hypothetical protein